MIQLENKQPEGLPQADPTPAPVEKAIQPEPETIPAAPTPQVKRLTVLITGATSGIGKATATLFAQKGHRLILTGRRQERLDAMAQQFREQYQSDILTLCFDVREAMAVQENLENLPKPWEVVDVLINNAGLAKGLAPIHEGSLLHWDTMIDTNLKGLLYVTRCIAPGMVQRRQGHIINIGSSAGKEVYPNGNVYCATKFGVDALTRAIRLDLHAYNIRVSQVSPGHVEETEFAVTRFDGDVERARIYNDFQPLTSPDVADAIYYMVSAPPHVNIQDIAMFGTQQASSTMIDRSGRKNKDVSI
ncbi:MAG: SDR family NAD(P)-dependent oxidoreductase [Lewinellaceae bacterium]|nr:SDR family NAD(P)-dependent oxidoreductase [Lewinellaceae bacterium]